VVIGNMVLRDYRPTVIGWFPSTGIVIDDKGHVLTFVGYRWVDIDARNPRVEIVDGQGQKHPAKLVGIDQNMMLAVILCQGMALKKTPLCVQRCDMKNGVAVVLPAQDGSKTPQLESAQVLSVSTGGDSSVGGGWAIKINRPMSAIGAPILNTQNQVIGLIADQPTGAASTNPRVDVVNVDILSLSQMLSSADKIIKAGGDIQTGWLGVHVDTDVDSRAGVKVDSVEKDSPAYKAGLLSDDVIKKWNGLPIHDLDKFVQMIQDTPLGSKAVMEVQRQGKALTLSAVIEARKPPDSSEKLIFEFPDLTALPGAQIATGDTRLQTSLGIQIVLLTPQLAESLQMPVRTGLLVASVNKQTAFDLAGILAGDIILGVDDVQVGDPLTFYDHIQTRGWGSSMVLRLLRKGKELKKTVQLPKLPGFSRKHPPR
jgi:serine protease Do